MIVQIDDYEIHITKIDETHFRSSMFGGFNKEGHIYHIDEIKKLPYYYSVKTFLEK